MLRLLLVYYFHVILAIGVTSFTTGPSLVHTVIPHYRTAKTGFARRSKWSLLTVANPDPANNNRQETETTSTDNYEADDDDDHVNYDVTPIERARILSYRTALGACAFLLSIIAIGDGGFLEGTGASIDDLVEQSTSVLPLVAGATLLLCPVPLGTIPLAVVTMASGLVVLSDIGQYEGVAWSLSMLTLMAVSIREIYYFGVEYKYEAGITLLMLPLMLDYKTHVPFTIPVCALGMAVLAAGKLFEPCKEDLIRSNSEFLAK